MDDNYLNLVLDDLQRNQNELKDQLENQIHITKDETEKKRLIDLLNFNSKIEQAIKEKNLELLQKLYADANLI